MVQTIPLTTSKSFIFIAKEKKQILIVCDEQKIWWWDGSWTIECECNFQSKTMRNYTENETQRCNKTIELNRPETHKSQPSCQIQIVRSTSNNGLRFILHHWSSGDLQILIGCLRSFVRSFSVWILCFKDEIE